MDIKKIVQDAFSSVVNADNISEETEIKSLGIDSLDLVESLMAMEEKLDIQFTDEEMLSFKTVGDVYKVIESKLSK